MSLGEFWVGESLIGVSGDIVWGCGLLEDLRNSIRFKVRSELLYFSRLKDYYLLSPEELTRFWSVFMVSLLSDFILQV